MATGDGELLVNLLKNTMHALMAVLGQRQVSQHLGESPKLPDHIIPAETSGLQYAGEVNDKVAVKGPELDVLGDFLEVPDAFALSRTFSRSRCLVTYNIFEGQDEASKVTPLNELRQPQVIGVENPQFDLQETEGKRVPEDERVVCLWMLEGVLDQNQSGFGIPGGGQKALDEFGTSSESGEFHQSSA